MNIIKPKKLTAIIYEMQHEAIKPMASLIIILNGKTLTGS